MGSSCPFCRKSFAASRIVKLHVDRPAKLEQGVEDVELLQRLDTEEAKRQVDLEAAVVELEAAVKQSKQRKRVLRESLERARQLRKQREEEDEARKQQQPTWATVAGKSASGAVPSPRETRIRDEMLQIHSESSVTHTVGASTPPSPRWGPEEGVDWGGEVAWEEGGVGGGWADGGVGAGWAEGGVRGGWAEGGVGGSSAEGGGWRTMRGRTRRGRGAGGGWSAPRRNTNANFTSSLASSTHARHFRWD